MVEVVGHRDAYNWSISKLADAFGMGRNTVSKRLNEAGVKPAGERRGNFVYALKEACPALFGPRGGPGPALDLDQYPEARKAWYQSELYRVQLEEKQGELISDAEHARALAFLVKTFAAAIDGLPDQLELDAGLEPEAIILVQAVCDGTRENTYQALIKYTGDPDAEDD